MTWIPKPYYPLPEPQVYVSSPFMNYPNSKTLTLSLECGMQSELYSTMSNIAAYLNPDYNTFLTARTLEALIADFTIGGVRRVQFYPAIGVDAAGNPIDPVALGVTYGRLQMTLMQQIDSGDGKTSLWDAWVAMTEPVK